MDLLLALVVPDDIHMVHHTDAMLRKPFQRIYV